MMVMTAKLNFKKILLILGAAAAIILSLILLLGGQPQQETAAPAYAGNEGRIAFLREKGWEVSPEPLESGRVKMPRETSPVYERYNNLQKSQGYDLSRYAGQKAMRYVYEVKNYPGATAPVYATLLCCKDQIIGGDITDTSAGGKIRGLAGKAAAPQKLPAPLPMPQPSESAPQDGPETAR